MSTASELLVIAKLKNELSRPLKQITGEQRALRAEIDKTGTATRAQSAQMRALQREYVSTTKHLGMMGDKLASVGSRMTRNVTLPIVLGLGLATKAALDDARSQVVLANTMRNTEHATSGQIKAQEDWIRKVQFATGVSDNELRPALGKLELAHFSVADAQHVLNVAMDVSIARGKPLTSVVEALARAHLGNTTSLKRLGVQTTDASGKALTYDQILQNLARTTGGSMAAAADTTSGKLARTQQRMQELGEDIGNHLIPIVDKGAKALSGMFDFFGHFGGAGQDFVIIGGLALAAVGPILRVAGGYLKLAKAYREWQAARAAGTAGGLFAEGGALAGIGGASVYGGVAAALIGSTLVEASISNNRTKGAKADALRAAGAGALPGATQAERLAAIKRLNREIEKQHGNQTSGPGGIIGDLLNSFGGSDTTVNKRVREAENLKSKTQQAYRNEQSNVAALTSKLHLNESAVRRLAAAHGIDLTGSLESVAADMKAASAAAKENGEAVSDQAAQYVALKKAIDGTRTSRDRLADRFLNLKQAGLDFADARDAYAKAKTPRERQAAEIALFRSGESYLDAGQTAGKYGPKGLSQVGFAANLQELLKPVLQGADPAGLRAIAQQYLSDAVSEDPKGAQLLQGARNQFTITQKFYGPADPKTVAAAAQDGFDAASKAVQHAENAVKRI